MTDNNNTSPSDDDIIPFETGIPLIDADPEVIARRLADSTWERRANFFSNIITGSITNAIEIGELYKDKDAEGEGGRVELNLTLCAIHERVGEILEIWGVEDPPDVHAACIFALSMSIDHRLKARAFFGSQGPDGDDRLMQKAWPNLAIANRVSMAARPGLSELWRRRDEDCKCQSEEGDAS